jgi:nucleoside-diphosphate-sugar epimerase
MYFKLFTVRIKKIIVLKASKRETHLKTSSSYRGDGSHARDFTYVTDVCGALEIVEKNKNCIGKIYNIDSGNTVSINKIVSLLGKKTLYSKASWRTKFYICKYQRLKGI